MEIGSSTDFAADEPETFIGEDVLALRSNGTRRRTINTTGKAGVHSVYSVSSAAADVERVAGARGIFYRQRPHLLDSAKSTPTNRGEVNTHKTCVVA
jgi:hypothetical protein